MPVLSSGKTAFPQRGFTLIELLIVMTLIGVASLLAVSGLDRFALRARDASWTDKVRTELVKLRNRAVLSGSPVRADVLFASGELRAAGDNVKRPSLQLPESFAFLPAGVAEGYADLAGQQRLPLGFFPDGTATEARFLLRDGDGRLQLFHIRGLTGRISIEPVAAGAELGLTPTLQSYPSALLGGDQPGGAGMPRPGGMGAPGGNPPAPASQGAGSFK